MKHSIESLVEKAFPGMGWRVTWLTLLSTLCLIVYFHHGSRQSCPAWFVEFSRGVWELRPTRFHQYCWSHLCAFVILMIVPLVVCRFAVNKPTELGLTIKNAKKEFLLVLGLFTAFLPVVWYFSTTEAFQNKYPRVSQVEDDAILFVAYESFYLIKWIAWEFFFRGFMLFAFKKDLGLKAVLISTIPFVLMHFRKPEPEVFASVAAGFILCWIALRSKSIWPGVLLHWLVATSMDFFASTWWR